MFQDTMDKEFISLLYLYDSKTREDLSKFSKHEGFLFHSHDAILTAVDQIRLNRPDLILIELDIQKLKTFAQQVKQIFKSDASFNPIVFFCCSKTFGRRHEIEPDGSRSS